MTFRPVTLICLHAGLFAGAQTPACIPTATVSCPAQQPKAAQRFPYPGEAPDTKPLETPEKKQVKDQFPYPGETPEAPAVAPTGESSSSSAAATPSADPDAKPGLKDEGTEGSSRRERRRLRPPAQKILSDQERVDEDLSIAHFYMQSGNLPGAYLRAKDAVRLQPQTLEAHYALAEAAQKMNKRDEAVAEYNKVLELDPESDEAKAARKSLEKLKP